MKIDPDALFVIAEDLSDAFEQFEKYQEKAEDIYQEFSEKDSNWDEIDERLVEVIDTLSDIRLKGRKLVQGLKECAEVYETTENDILDYVENNGKSLIEYLTSCEQVEDKDLTVNKVQMIIEMMQKTLDVVGYLPTDYIEEELGNNGLCIVNGDEDLLNALTLEIPFQEEQLEEKMNSNHSVIDINEYREQKKEK